jgi:hypothetical protein
MPEFLQALEAGKIEVVAARKDVDGSADIVSSSSKGSRHSHNTAKVPSVLLGLARAWLMLVCLVVAPAGPKTCPPEPSQFFYLKNSPFA